MKRLWLVLSLVAVVAAGIGYYAYNKGPRDIRNAKGIEATATELYSLYDADTSAAQKKYSGQVIIVSGQVAEVMLNQKGEKVVLLKSSSEGAYINCTLEENNGELKPGGSVKLKGLCSGIGQGDADLGIKGDVYLNRCVIVKQDV